MNDLNNLLGEIPYTDDIKITASAFAESIINAISLCKITNDVEINVRETMIDLVCLLLDKSGLFADIPEIARGISVNLSIIAFVDALGIFLNEIRKNKVMFENRQVIINTMRGELIKDNRSFLVGDSKGLFFNISEYTDDPKVIKAYNKIQNKIKHKKWRFW